MVEKKRKSPLLQLQIFENKLFSLSIFCGFISFVAMFCSTIIQPFYLQDVMKFSPSINWINTYDFAHSFICSGTN